MSLVMLYTLSTIFMISAALVMIIRLFGHLEVKENRELFLMVTGLLLDLTGCIGTCYSIAVSEMMMAYRISLIGRGIFGIGFILYIGRLFHAKHARYVMETWFSFYAAGFLFSLFYDYENPYLCNVYIGKYVNVSLLLGDRGYLYYFIDALLIMVELWAIVLVVKEYYKIRKAGDRVQAQITIFSAFAIALEMLSFVLYELSYDKWPNYTPIFRGVMACIYSFISMKYHYMNNESLALDTLLNDIGAGFVVATDRYRLLYHNGIADDVFPELKKLAGTAPYSETIEKAVRMREFEVRKNDMTYRVTADRVFSNKKVAGYSIVITNITDVVQLEQQALSAHSAKTNILINMAHEVRTPLNAITGAAEMMLSAESQKDMFSLARDIQTSVSALNDSFSSIVDAIDEDNTNIILSENPYSMCTLLENVIDSCADKAAKKKIDFEVQISEYLHVSALGDDVNVRKILVNVLSNAIRYTDNGKVSFAADSISDNDSDCMYKFVITDMSERVAKDVSEETNKGIGTVDTDDNTGIGILLARRLVASMGGTFKMWTDKSGVNVFSIQLPQKLTAPDTIKDYFVRDKLKLVFAGSTVKHWKGLTDACDLMGVEYEMFSSSQRTEYVNESNRMCIIVSECDKSGKRTIDFARFKNCCFATMISRTELVNTLPGEVAIREPLSILTLRKMFMASDLFESENVSEPIKDFIAPSAKVLVVDDDLLNRRIAVQLLEGFRIKVASASGGFECIDMIEKGASFDIILMDYMMDGINGIETTRRLKELPVWDERTKIVAFTANDVIGIKEKYLEAGMVGCLFKPAGREQFGQMLLNYLPKELIKESSKDDTSIINMGNLPVIDGVYPYDAMKYVSGNVNTYLDLLGEFGQEIYKKSARISELYALNDLYDFTIMVHGIKSASRMLGMNDLSRMMEDLEHAGSAQDLAYISDNLTPVLDYYESFVKKLEPYGKKSSSEDGVTDRYHRLLTEMKEALEEFEMEKVDELMSLILKEEIPESDTSHISALKVNLEEADYYASMSLIDALLRHK